MAATESVVIGCSGREAPQSQVSNLGLPLTGLTTLTLFASACFRVRTRLRTCPERSCPRWKARADNHFAWHHFVHAACAIFVHHNYDHQSLGSQQYSYLALASLACVQLTVGRTRAPYLLRSDQVNFRGIMTLSGPPQSESCFSSFT